ncbi:hypothetical protein V6N11_034875 [Hibiscus sabdariffa]|uniref:Uncharacterized protein n=1 Tax=Hibiscus sabdariffa TaxID=183260 RepID=A0ABR2AHX5_9ROSI
MKGRIRGCLSREATGPARADILAGTSEFGRASCCVTGLSLSPAELVHAFGLGHEPYSLVSNSSASAGKSALAGNMPDSAQIFRGRFTKYAPADAVVAALASSECHQPGTDSVQLPIWH